MLMAALSAAGQSDAKPKPLQFDVVSIKQNHSGDERGMITFAPDSDRVVVVNAPMYRIMEFAFSLQKTALVLGAPQWTYTDRWDMEAKVSAADLPVFRLLSFEEKEHMLQQVLAERCRMQASAGKKDVPVYALSVAKNGLKMHEEKPTGPGWDMTVKRGEIRGRAVPIEALAFNMVDASLGRPILDRTGLTGTYTFDLRWTPEDDPGKEAGAEPQHPGIFTAIEEQLGLRLVATKGIVDAMMIDHIEKPTAN
jgi:uncharacterized protein (TIGR03435 family)